MRLASGIRTLVALTIVEIIDAGHFDCIIKPQFREEIGRWVRKPR
jgi:hypothetical protein